MSVVATYKFWLRYPHLLVPRLAYWVWEKWHPDAPWLCPGTVRFLDRHLTRSMRGVEFGSGRSTAWFARRLGQLTSIEESAGWYDKVRQQLEAWGIANVNYRLIPLDHSTEEPERPHYDPLPAYVAAIREFSDGSLDLVVVDGHYRTTCIRNSLPKIAPGGLLLVDDANLWGGAESVPVPPSWELADLSRNGIKQSAIWRALA